MREGPPGFSLLWIRWSRTLPPGITKTGRIRTITTEKRVATSSPRTAMPRGFQETDGKPPLRALTTTQPRGFSRPAINEPRPDRCAIFRPQQLGPRPQPPTISRASWYSGILQAEGCAPADWRYLRNPHRTHRAASSSPDREPSRLAAGGNGLGCWTFWHLLALVAAASRDGSRSDPELDAALPMPLGSCFLTFHLSPVSYTCNCPAGQAD